MSYYVVKRGRIPGIYNDWIDCEKQIKSFSNAQFKKFEDYDLALVYQKQDAEITLVVPTSGIAVDAAYSMKKGIGEYQMFDLDLDIMIYKSREYTDVTVNIMEFLAIVRAIKTYPGQTIYSDSATAITWVSKKHIKSNAVYDGETEKEIKESILYLNNNILVNDIVKWDTKVLGEIPADFHRK